MCTVDQRLPQKGISLTGFPGFPFPGTFIVTGAQPRKEQIIDDLNGIISPLQRKMMRTLLKHLDDGAHLSS